MHRVVGVLVHRETLVGHQGFTDIVHLEEEACTLEAEVRISDEQGSLSPDSTLGLQGKLLVSGRVVRCVVGGVPIAFHAKVYAQDLRQEEAQI